ncbi:AAA family ATPase, partial [Candidatus Entotheonella palauensis]|uniref:AAA family ATPase n=1 Tax=Candidatus Entotheonella palauensis TaxID=93172 RepID=UPI000B7CBF0F
AAMHRQNPRIFSWITVESTVSAVRRAVGDSGRAQRVIETLSGHGYRFIASVEVQDEASAAISVKVQDEASAAISVKIQDEAPAAASVKVPNKGRAQNVKPVSPAVPAPLRTASRERPLPQRKRPLELARPRGSARPRQPVSPFVGRSSYLSWFEYALKDALMGRPTALFLEGEAGMGKTRLVKVIQDMAQTHGFQVYAGRCAEDLSLPYMPFIRALRGPWRQLATELEPDLDVDARRINQWLQLEAAPPVAAGLLPTDAGEQDKLQLFLAVARMFIMLAQRQPVLLVLDDLHWADALSLELFAHVIFTIADMPEDEAAPLMFIGTHRPVPPQGHLAHALARFRREEICEFLDLPGLDEGEIHLLLHGLGLERASQQLVHTLYEVTSGNPLFIQELLQYLQRRNALHTQDGYLMTTASPAELRLPDQVTSVLLNHVEDLSAECRQLLIIASLMGDAFEIDVLCEVSNLSEEAVLVQLEEALHQGILQSEGQLFQFAHPLMQHVLYHLPSVAQRQRLHWQVAQSFERLDRTQHDEHLLQMAHHLARSGPVADTGKVMQYVRQAGDHAYTMLDWQDASHYYETVLTAADRALPAADLADLHYRAGFAYARDGNVSLSDGHFDRAAESYRSDNDVHGHAQALVQKMLRAASASYGNLLDTQPLEELLEEVGENDLELRGQLAIYLSELYWAGWQRDQADRYAHYGLAIGQELEAYDLCARACFTLALSELQDLEVRPALEQYQQAREYAQQAGNLWFECWVIQRMSSALVLVGQFDDVRAMAEEVHEVTSQTNNWEYYGLTQAALASLGLATGTFEAAEYYAREAVKSVARYRFSFGGVLGLPTLACAHAVRGARQEAESAIDMLVEPGAVFEQPASFYVTMAQVYRHIIRLYTTGETPPSETLEELLDLPWLARCDSASLSLICALGPDHMKVDTFGKPYLHT